MGGFPAGPVGSIKRRVQPPEAINSSEPTGEAHSCLAPSTMLPSPQTFDSLLGLTVWKDLSSVHHISCNQSDANLRARYDEPSAERANSRDG